MELKGCGKEEFSKPTPAPKKAQKPRKGDSMEPKAELQQNKVKTGQEVQNLEKVGEGKERGGRQIGIKHRPCVPSRGTQGQSEKKDVTIRSGIHPTYSGKRCEKGQGGRETITSPWAPRTGGVGLPIKRRGKTKEKKKPNNEGLNTLSRVDNAG